jgi:hypothetical protein
MAQLGQKAHGFKDLDFLMVLGFASVVFGFIGGREMVFPAETQRRRGKRRERILRVGGGFIMRSRAGRSQGWVAGTRGGVLRWGGSAWVGPGCFRRGSVSPGSPGSAGLGAQTSFPATPLDGEGHAGSVEAIRRRR